MFSIPNECYLKIHIKLTSFQHRNKGKVNCQPLLNVYEVWAIGSSQVTPHFRWQPSIPPQNKDYSNWNIHEHKKRFSISCQKKKKKKITASPSTFGVLGKLHSFTFSVVKNFQGLWNSWQMTHEATSAFFFCLQLNSFELDTLMDTKFCPVYTPPPQVCLWVIFVRWFHSTLLSVTTCSVSVICFVGSVKDGSSGIIGTGCM